MESYCILQLCDCFYCPRHYAFEIHPGDFCGSSSLLTVQNLIVNPAMHEALLHTTV